MEPIGVEEALDLPAMTKEVHRNGSRTKLQARKAGRLRAHRKSGRRVSFGARCFRGDAREDECAPDWRADAG